MNKSCPYARTTGSLLVLVLLLMAVGSAVAQALPRDVRMQLIAATVQINAWDDNAGVLVPFTGSGTIISPEGHILTNYHVIGHLEERQHYEWHGIFLTDVSSSDLPPSLEYWARFVAGDPLLDLAILQIEELGDQSPVPADTVFPAIPVGDSHSLLPGDTLTVVGYPGISGSTITFTQGLMSGWLGEDFSSGGRQWIKTDTKIAGGNSGGAAVDERGNLVGIPTAGIHVLEDEVYEEQLYVRPVALAWALIGPHVPTVVRADTPPAATTVSTVVTQTPPAVGTDTTPVSQVPVTAPPPGPDTVAVPSGHQGALAIGQSISRTAAATPDQSTTWHSYAVSVPAGQPQVTVTVTSDDDIDFAYRFGTEILDWTDVDFIEDTLAHGGSSTVADPPAGLLYIDVLNAYARPIHYTLSVTGAAQTINYPQPVPFGHVGEIALGQTVPGNLQQEPGDVTSSTFHSYTFTVPAGLSHMTVVLEAVAELDLALKHGSEILSYAEADEGGDWHLWEWTPEGGGRATIPVDNPAAGTWYLDVVNFGNLTVDGRYTLRIDPF